jgi:acyl carrier protein
MHATEVAAKVKEIINNVTSIPVDEIDDQASLRDDLDLDSLSLMEIGVDIDYAFQLGLPDETLQKIGTVQDAVALVLEHRSVRTA